MPSDGYAKPTVVGRPDFRMRSLVSIELALLRKVAVADGLADDHMFSRLDKLATAGAKLAY